MVLVWALLAVATATAVSKNVYVDSVNGKDANPCTSMQLACQTLERAFAVMNPTGRGGGRSLCGGLSVDFSRKSC